ncbi:MAG TPA: serine/threonine-protein kinase [Nannocystaceae bacterium]|nr:serine/threonine-protein kinase [Nannocystaceae bacterium]
MIPATNVEPPSSCPDEDTLAEFVAGACSDRTRESIERHIDACTRCAETLALFGGAFAVRSLALPLRSDDDRSDVSADAEGRTDDGHHDGEDPPLDPEQRFAGRYRIRECIGAGAGGTVYAAYDPELDRVIALKVLRGAVTSGASSPNRFTREAKVMAKVAHPNVVAVHDVGVSGGHVFIATELVDGDTLDAWLAAKTRSWTEVLDVFVAAGRGLAAIHDTGLVHRDFKPGNVMVGRDGRVRVTDFGLARLRPEIEQRADEDLVTASDVPTMSPGMLAETLATQTRTGALVGTPAYMSPEQWRSQPADARSDQFSYCVALYEALFGRRPFIGRTAAELSASVCDDDARAPHGCKVPRWLTQAVLRGLSRTPEQRFRDMQALLFALTDGPRRVRARRGALAIGLALVAVAGAGYGARGLHTEGPCDGDRTRFEQVWDDDVRASLAERLVTSPGEFDALAPLADDWIARWQRSRAQACGELDGEDARAALLQVSCLDRRFVQLRSTLAVIREPALGRMPAALMLGGVQAPERCLEGAVLLDIEPSYGTPVARGLSEQLAPDIDRIEALRLAGRLDEGLAVAIGVVAQAEIDGDHAVRAEALLALGQIHSARKEPALAEHALRAAVWAAEASGHVEVAADGWTELASVLGTMQEHYDEGIAAAERARAVLQRMHDPARELTLEADVATMESINGHYEAALAAHSDVLARAQELLGPNDRQVARIHMNMAAVLANLGRIDEASAHADAGLAIQRAEYPGPHPVTVEMLNTVGALAVHEGDLAHARAALEQALAMAELALLTDHATTASVLTNLGNIEMDEGRYAPAVERLERALSIYRSVHGPEHADVALAIHNLAGAYDKSGDVTKAIALYREALAMRRRVSGEDHPGTANSMHNLGLVLTNHGELDEGIALLEGALAIRDAKKVDPFRRASSAFMLAKAYDRRGDRVRAIALAERARVLLQGIAPRKAEVLTAVEAWLAAH